MDFLNPIYLFLLSAAALPLLIHLLNRRKVREVPFSTLRFIKRSDRRSMRKINLRKLILLLLRMAAIACAALAFSRPVITGGLAALFPGGGPKAICILLDRSGSMAVSERQGLLMDRAVEKVSEIARSANDEDEVTVILFDERREVLFEGERFTAAVVSEITDGLEPSWYATSIREAVRAGMKVLDSGRRVERELYIISDFQRNAFGSSSRNAGEDVGDGEMPVSEEIGNETRPVRVFMVPVQAGEGANVSIDEVLTPMVAIHKGEVASVSVTMRNHSERQEATFPLRVRFDDRIVFERQITIPPMSARAERFDLAVEKEGWILGEVFKSPDRQRKDDSAFFTILAREKTSVLLLGDGSDVYLRTALDPGGRSGDVTLIEKSWDELTTGDLQGAEVVVTGTVPPRSPAELELVRRFVGQGGKALVFLSEKTAKSTGTLSAHDIAIRTRRQGAVRTLIDPVGDPGFLGPFGREDLRNLSRLRFAGGVDVEGVPPQDILLSFRSGMPFIWRERQGKGVMMFVAAGLEPAEGDLVLSPFFLPLVHQAVLAMDPGDPGVEGMLVGSDLVIEGEAGEVYDVVFADGTTGSATPGVDDGGAIAVPVIVPAGDNPGHVKVLRGEETLMVLAVNPPSFEESSQNLMSGREAADSLGLEHFAVLGDETRVEGSIREAREGREISAQLAMLALALLSVELIISQKREMAVG